MVLDVQLLLLSNLARLADLISLAANNKTIDSCVPKPPLRFSRRRLNNSHFKVHAILTTKMPTPVKTVFVG